jgi:hypothetical protein
VLPVGPGGFEFGFESDDTLDASAFKRLIVEEAVSFRTERAMNRKAGRPLSGVTREGDAKASVDLGGDHSARGAGAMPGKFYASGSGPATIVK